jgi:hypothetical protein
LDFQEGESDDFAVLGSEPSGFGFIGLAGDKRVDKVGVNRRRFEDGGCGDGPDNGTDPAKSAKTNSTRLNGCVQFSVKSGPD